jgi:cytochrome c heme-lyase
MSKGCTHDPSSKEKEEINPFNFIPNNLPPSETNSLSRERQISSIPMATSEDKNWVYPSAEQFYSAMKRKNYSPKEEDMKTVIPIHNAGKEKNMC